MKNLSTIPGVTGSTPTILRPIEMMTKFMLYKPYRGMFLKGANQRKEFGRARRNLI